MKNKFSLVLFFVGILINTAMAQQPVNNCADADKVLGINFDATQLKERFIIVSTITGMQSNMVLKPSDEVLSIDGKIIPKDNVAGLNVFLKKLPAVGNDFEIKRAGAIIHVKVNKSCPILGLITNGPAVRNALLRIMAAKEGNFKSIMGAPIKKTDNKAGQSYVSTVDLLYGDKPMVITDSDPIYDLYSNIIVDELKLVKAQEIFSYWQQAIAKMFPKFTAQPLNTSYGLMHIKDYVSDIDPKCKLSVTLMGFNENFSVMLTIKDVKEKPINKNDYDDLFN